MKRSRPLWPFMCIAALIVILGVGGFFLLSPQTGGGAGSFPQWEKAAALEEETYPSDLAYGGIDTSRAGTDGMDRVLVTLEAHQPYLEGGNYRVDYRQGDSWYTVYATQFQNTLGVWLASALEDATLEYRVPAGLFSVTGEYRLLVEDMGVCEFTVEEPTGSAVSRAPEPEKESSASVVYEYDATTGKATAVPAEQYGDDDAPTVSQPEGDIEMKFPQWEEAAALPSTQEGVRFSFDRIGPTGDDESSQTDSVYLTLEKQGDTTCGPNYWVNFLYEDTWYTVYDANIQAEYTQVIGGGAGALPVEYTVPRGLFQVAGSYRLCVDSLGYCEFSIDEPLSYIEPTVSHPEGESTASVPSQAAEP